MVLRLERHQRCLLEYLGSRPETVEDGCNRSFIGDIGPVACEYGVRVLSAVFDMGGFDARFVLTDNGDAGRTSCGRLLGDVFTDAARATSDKEGFASERIGRKEACERGVGLFVIGDELGHGCCLGCLKAAFYGCCSFVDR
jgi:hypothetical protein